MTSDSSILAQGYADSRGANTPPSGPGVFDHLFDILKSLDKPAGAVRSTILGQGPAAGFENPEDYHLYSPTDTPVNKLTGNIAEAFLDPLNLLGAKYLSPIKEAGFGTRLAAEGAINAASRVASMGATDLSTDMGAPDWVSQGLGLAAGIAAGGAANKGIAKFGESAIEAASPEIRAAVESVDRNPLDALAQTNPTAVLASRTIGETSDLGALQTATDQATAVSALDDTARSIRKSAMASGGSPDLPPDINTQEAVNNSRSLDVLYKARQDTNAVNAVDIMKEQVANLPDQVKMPLMPTWLGRVVNGQLNRSPLAAQSARIGHDYISAQATTVSSAMHAVNEFVDSELGQFGEKVSLNATATDDVKRAFSLAQTNQYGNAAVGVIVENPEMFNLSTNQRQSLLQIQNLSLFDSNLSTKFGVDTSYLYKGWNEAIADARAAGDTEGVKRLTALKASGANSTGVLANENYARHMVDLAGPDGKPLPQDQWPRFLGAERSFQRHRLLDSWTDVVNSAADSGAFQQKLTRAIATAGTNGEMEEVKRLTDLSNSGVQVAIRRGTFAESVGERLSQSSKQRGEALAIQTLRNGGGDINAENELKSLLNTTKISDAIRVPAEAAGLLRSLQLRADISLFGVQSWGAAVMGRGLKGGIEGGFNAFKRTIGTEEGWARFQNANADRMSNAQLHDLVLDTSILELPNDLDLLKRKWFSDNSSFPGIAEKGRGVVQGPGTLQSAGTAGMNNRGLLVDSVKNPTHIPINAGDLIANSLNTLDKIQFGRMATAWKLDTYDHLTGLMTSARDGHMGFMDMLTHPSLGLSGITGRLKNMSDDEIKRASASFTNNLYGGLNSVAQGRTVTHNLVEQLFALTPGFTRGTVSIGLQAANLKKWTPENALARDFAVRGTLLGGLVVAGMADAINGALGHGMLPPVNVTDPTKGDWMAIPLPDGKFIRPLARFRSTGALVGATVDKMLSDSPLAAAQYFTGSALRWATYRQSALVSGTLGDPVGDVARAWGPREVLGKDADGKDILGDPVWNNAGNQFAEGKGILNLLVDPSNDRQKQLWDVASQGLPVGIGQAMNSIIDNRGLSPAALKDAAFIFSTELLGQNEKVPTLLERNVSQLAGEAAKTYGLSDTTISGLIADNQSPLDAKDERGKYLLTNAQRKDATERIAAQLGVEPQVISQRGRLTAPQKQAIASAIDENQTTNFFATMKDADTKYSQAMTQAQRAVENGIPLTQVSSFISDARKARASIKASGERLNPIAIAFLQSPDRVNKQNDHDTLMSAIAAEAFAKDFFDPETLTFDFDGRDQFYSSLRDKYGKSFDVWQAQADSKKTPLELAHDRAFDRLGSYFGVGDEIWQQVTGGELGKTEKDFDTQLRKAVSDQGVGDVATQNLIISKMKSQMKPIVVAHQLTSKTRDVMRASDPQTEQDVTQWLGAQPIETKQVSKADRAYLNQLLATAD